MKKVQFPVFIILIGLFLSGCPEPTRHTDCSIVVTFSDACMEETIRNEIDKPEGDICLCDVKSITSLYIYYSCAYDLPGIENLTSLKYLYLGADTVNDISALAGLTSLQEIIARENNIPDISALAGLTSLKSLELSACNISDISALAGLTSLKSLKLQNKDISDISALAGLTSLKTIYLSDNSISDISPLLANKGINEHDEVYLRNNPLNDDSINIYIPALEARGVDVRY